MTRVGTYSGGMQRRLALARALLTRPDVIVLDEPTLGVDVQSRAAIWERVRTLAEEGKTVLLTTNYMEEAQALAGRLAIIDHGALVAHGTPAELQQQAGQRFIDIEANWSLTHEVELRHLPGVQAVESHPPHMRVIAENQEQILPALLDYVAREKITPRSITMKEPDLNDVFLQLTGRTLRDQPRKEEKTAMARFLEAALALAWKDLLRFSRQPFLVVVSVVMPLMFILFYAIIVPSSATAPVVVAMEDDSPLAQQFVQALRAIHSREAPYYELVTTNPEQARRMFANAEAFGMIVIPPTFDAQVEAGTAQVELHIRNINSDYSKNLALRLDDAVRTFAERSGSPTFTIEETSTFAQDPTMADYISTSLLLFGCLYSAMLNTGLHIASEWNDRTIKTLLLAPTSRSALITGKVLALPLAAVAGVVFGWLLLRRAL